MLGQLSSTSGPRAARQGWYQSTFWLGRGKWIGTKSHKGHRFLIVLSQNILWRPHVKIWSLLFWGGTGRWVLHGQTEIILCFYFCSHSLQVSFQICFKSKLPSSRNPTDLILHLTLGCNLVSGKRQQERNTDQKQKRWLSRNLTPPRFLVQVLRQAPVPPRGIVKEWEPEALNPWSSPPHVRFKRNNGQKESSENRSWANHLFLSKCLWFRQEKKYEIRSGLRCKRAIKELSTGIQKAPF